jgi:pilus assembly protein CpaC
VRLSVGRSTVLDVGADIARVSLTSAEIADALVTSPKQLLINGKLPGTISMFVWDRAGALKRYEVVVQRDLARLSEQMNHLFPGEKIDVQSNGRNVVVSGTVTRKDLIEKIVNVAAGYVDKRDEVVSLLQLQTGAPSNQVLLRVRFAEVSRNALTELGVNLAANGYKDRWIGRSTTQQFGGPSWDEQGRFVFSDFLNLFLFDTQNGLAGAIKALQQKGLFQSLAEPNLVAESGKEASFLAGGEFPIPVAQGGGANLAISIVFKEFGIRLNFTPTVTDGGRVHLKVRPEVSTLDFNNAVFMEGFRIPALTTRRTETELELADGQTFAIAGLINNQVRSSLHKIPGIGDIPILGLLFQSKAAQKDQTELVVMITPQILPNNSRGVTPDLPRPHEPYLRPQPPNKTHENPPPAFGGATAPTSNQRAASMGVTPAGSPNPAAGAVAGPATAAASVSPLNPADARRLEDAATTPNDPATAAAASVSARPLTKEEKKALEQARRAEQEQAEAQAKAKEEAARHAQKAAREQAKRDGEQLKRDQEAARRQAEEDARKKKSIDEAAARLKAAEAAYQAELAKKSS